MSPHFSPVPSQAPRASSSPRPPHGRSRLAACCLMLVWGLWAVQPALAAKDKERSHKDKDPAPEKTAIRSAQKQMNQKQGDLQDLRGKLTHLRKEVATTEKTRSDVADQLQDVERNISSATRELRDLADQRNALQDKLHSLADQSRVLSGTLDTQQNQLQKLVVRQYTRGDTDSLRLLLNGNDPNQIARDMYYLSAVAKARSALMQQLGESLKQKQALAEETKRQEGELARVEAKQKEEQARLESLKQQRQATLAQLSDRIADRRKQITSLQQDEKHLSDLVANLSKSIAEAQAREKARAEAAAKARAKAEAAARAKAEAEAKAAARAQALAREKAAKAGKPLPPPKPIPRPAPPPREPELQNEKIPEAVPSGAFARLKGSLHLPVRGAVSNRFGSKRGEGGSWKGVFVRAGAGSEVRAVAGGRVAFADWMRGFGNLLIIDHGDGYMTIYGNNESLYKKAGDTVKGGDVIGAVGSSGGNGESGLYFELRRQGQPLDPLQWVGLK